MSQAQRTAGRVGRTLSYDVHLVNRGTTTATSPRVELELSPGLSSVVAIADGFYAGNCVRATSSRPITCSVEDLPSGRRTTITVYVRPLVVGDLPVTARASTTAIDVAEGNNTATTALSVREVTTTSPTTDGELSVTTTTPDPVAPHGTISYVAQLVNTGSLSAPAVVGAGVPPGTTLVGFAASKGQCDLTDAYGPLDPFLPSPGPTGVAVKAVSCRAALGGGETWTVTMTVKVDHAGLVRSSWDSRVGVDESCLYGNPCGPSTPWEADYRNNWAVVDRHVTPLDGGNDLFVTHTADPASFFDLATSTSYSLLRYETTIVNGGPSSTLDASGLTISIPSGRPVHALVSSPGVACTTSVETVTCSIDRLEVNEEAKVSLTVLSTDGAAASTAEVASATDLDRTNDRKVAAWAYPST